MDIETELPFNILLDFMGQGPGCHEKSIDHHPHSCGDEGAKCYITDAEFVDDIVQDSEGACLECEAEGKSGDGEEDGLENDEGGIVTVVVVFGHFTCFAHFVDKRRIREAVPDLGEGRINFHLICLESSTKKFWNFNCDWF